MVEQSIADVLSLRVVGGEALTNCMKQLQTVRSPATGSAKLTLRHPPPPVLPPLLQLCDCHFCS
jgi:hypothetical protein